MSIPDSFDDDLKLLDRYQSYSSEIVRLSLLGIAWIGFLYTNKTDDLMRLSDFWIKSLFFSSIIMMGFAVFLGTLHKYFSTDSMAHMLYLTRLKTKEKPDQEDINKINKETEARNIDFKYSERLIYYSTWLLATSGILIGISFARLIYISK